MEGVFDTGLLLFHFHFGRRADANYRDPTNQLGQPLL
jgi:hypothetical protein